MAIPESPADDLRAALAVRHELGPDFEPEIVESFLERLDRTIEARVDARVNARPAEAPAAERSGTPAELVFASMLGGLLATGVIGVTMQADGIAAVFLVWIVVAVINVAHAVAGRPPTR
ncbi:hypothetical protein [Actinomadura sp. 9N407]|uniref:hypothetical protein n=1 Tax=Actinomadura sp. 9N407 TaxID=3375154 RepID=UPI003792FB9F